LVDETSKIEKIIAFTKLATNFYEADNDFLLAIYFFYENGYF